MYVIREILSCRPGQVRQMVDRFGTLAAAVRRLGHPPPRLLTDVAGEHFWTVVAEITVPKIEDFFEMEQQLRTDPAVAEAMTGYHEFIASGRREIYRIVT